MVNPAPHTEFRTVPMSRLTSKNSANIFISIIPVTGLPPRSKIRAYIHGLRDHNLFPTPSASPWVRCQRPSFIRPYACKHLPTAIRIWHLTTAKANGVHPRRALLQEAPNTENLSVLRLI